MLVDRRAILAGSALSVGLALAGCNSAPRTLRYRLTIEVETPEGLRTGSSIVQIVMRVQDGFFKGWGNYIVPEITGEAVTVDLGSRGILFALLTGGPRTVRGGDPVSLVFHSFPQFAGMDVAPYYDELLRTKPKAILSRDQLPKLVRFRNLRDPKSVEIVDSADLAICFGSNVLFRAAALEVVDGPVTSRVRTILPWIDEYYAKQLDGQQFQSTDATNSVANSLSAGSFTSRRAP